MKLQTIRHLVRGLAPVLLALAISAPVSAQQRPGLDHFECYSLLFMLAGPVPPDDPIVTMRLRDQFGEERVILGDESSFCNPAEKRIDGTVTPIVNKNNHLTFYTFEPVTQQTMSGEVTVFNQFGQQKYAFKSANLLAVPTEKQVPGLDPPSGLDHFRCYFIDGKLPKDFPIVRLVDQFQKAEYRVTGPHVFCNPVRKVVELDDGTEDVTEIANPDAHLTCYTTTFGNAPHPQNIIVIANQFTGGSTKDLFLSAPYFFCVPSQKEDFKFFD